MYVIQTFGNCPLCGLGCASLQFYEWHLTHCWQSGFFDTFCCYTYRIAVQNR